MSWQAVVEEGTENRTVGATLKLCQDWCQQKVAIRACINQYVICVSRAIDFMVELNLASNQG